METAIFDYQLPEKLIAQAPLPDRPASRMLVVDRSTGDTEPTVFSEFPRFLKPGDCLVINDTRVFPARIRGQRRDTGGIVEALLLEELQPNRWHAMMKPGRRLRPGLTIDIDPNQEFSATIRAKREDGTFEIEFQVPNLYELLEQHGQIPLPPYIHRNAEEDDRNRYQTVYARETGAVAAPTAGLHFTPDILEQIRRQGVQVHPLTLHVGPGTFQPVKCHSIEEHHMHEERFSLPPATALAVNQTRRNGGRVVAVGTTVVRVLESCVQTDSGEVLPQTGRTRLFLYPPATPRVTDALLTNFHLPRSTLLMLVCTFSSIDHVLRAYRRAVAEKFRFFSYGDCMLLIQHQ